MANRIHSLFHQLLRAKKPLVTKSGARGQWGLTPAGVEAARRLSGVRGRNLTADFLDNRLKKSGGLQGGLMNLLRASIARKLPTSISADLLDDHIQNCFTRLISRDSLRERLLENQGIPDSLLATYTVRAAYTDIRDSGTEPVTREYFGARTERERATGTNKGLSVNPQAIWSRGPASQSVLWAEDPSGQKVLGDVVVHPRSFGGESVAEEWLSFEDCMSQIEGLLRAKRTCVKDRYLEILRLQATGHSIHEIAAQTGLTNSHASAILTAIRQHLRNGYQRGALTALTPTPMVTHVPVVRRRLARTFPQAPQPLVPQLPVGVENALPGQPDRTVISIQVG